MKVLKRKTPSLPVCRQTGETQRPEEWTESSINGKERARAKEGAGEHAANEADRTQSVGICTAEAIVQNATSGDLQFIGGGFGLCFYNFNNLLTPNNCYGTQIVKII